MYEYFIENELISSSQSGFKPEDSCINQLLSITRDIYQSFDNGFEVRGVILDISKAFDKFWHKGLIYKLKQNGVAGNLPKTLADFLKDRKKVKSSSKLSKFNMDHCQSRGSSRFNSWTATFLNIYKWLIWKPSFES